MQNPLQFLSTEKGLDVYEKLNPDIKMKSCEQAGQTLKAKTLQFILKMKKTGQDI